MERKEQNLFVKGALFLTLAGLISKVFSSVYRIFLQNLTGDFGFYIYQQVYPFLGMIIILSLYGFPSAIAKIVAQAKRDGKELSVRSVYGPIFVLLFMSMAIISVLLFLNSGNIAILMGDENLFSAYRSIALALLLIPIISLLRGILQGFQRMEVIALSQIGEQLLRVGIIIAGALLIYYGHFSLYRIGVFGVMASIVGAVFAIGILLIFMRRERVTTLGEKDISWTYYGKTLLFFGVLASLNHMILLLVQFADVFTLVPQLIKGGLSPLEGMELKGVFDRGMPLVQFGAVIGSSFALALVPEVASKSLQQTKQAIHRAIKISLFFSLGATLGLIVIFQETNVLLYMDDKGTRSLQILTLAIVLSSLSITMVAILQSLGYYKRTGMYILITFILKWIGNLLLVPSLHITGSALATVFSLLFLVIVSYIDLKRNVPGITLCCFDWLRPLLIGSIGMVAFLILAKTIYPYGEITSRLGLLVYELLLVSVGAVLYIVSIVRFGAFSEEELADFPFRKVLTRIYKGRDYVE